MIYLDNCATTTCDPEVVIAISDCLAKTLGNPSSSNVAGKRALRLIQRARLQIANLIGANPDELIFTSGATESNNLALLCSIGQHERSPTNVVISPIDHVSVTQVAAALEHRGLQVRRLQVDSHGIVAEEDVERCIDQDTRLLSLAMVNSEIGTIQQVNAIGARCRREGILFHVDASQAVGRVAVSVGDISADLLSLSGHKIYGPPGIGVLYVRQQVRERLQLITFGGGQQQLRSGTLPTALIVGLGLACHLAATRQDTDAALATTLRDTFLRQLQAIVPDIELNSSQAHCVPHILNFRAAGLSAETLVVRLHDIAISAGSACSSKSAKPSAVLTGIGLSAEQAQESVRVCFSRHLDNLDVQMAASKIGSAILAIRGDWSAEQANSSVQY
jgi:cysteine desulfurase